MHPVSRRALCLFSCLLALTLSGFPSPAAAQDVGYSTCCIMDRPTDVLWQLGGGYAFPADNTAARWDDLGILEFRGVGSLAYVETESWADFNIEVQADTRILQGFDGTSSGYPLNRLNLFVEYSQRLEHGLGFKLDASPGLYSDLQDFGGDDLGFPLGFSAVAAMHEELSFLLGVSVFPGFERVADPRLGLRWAPVGGGLRVDLFYPESLITAELTSGFGIHAGARFLPWLEYQLEEDDARDRLRFQENRVYGGLHFAVGEYGRLNLEGGLMFEREIEFKKAEPTVELDDAPFVGLTFTSLI